MLLGASTLYARNDPLTPSLLAGLRATGMACVELTDYHPNWSYLSVAWLRDLAHALDASGLTLNSVHTHFAWYDPALVLFHAEPGRRRRAVDMYRRAIDALAMLGSPILVTHDLALPEANVDGADAHAHAREALVGSLREVADEAAASGVRVAIENTTRGYAAAVSALHGLITDAGRANVGICIDTGHANLVGSAADAIRAAGDRLITLQVDDSRDHQTQHTLPGRGTTDWQGVMRSLADIGYTGAFVYELNDPDDIPLVAENYDTLVRAVRPHR